jgi:hypothetical protein
LKLRKANFAETGTPNNQFSAKTFGDEDEYDMQRD